MAKTTPAEQLAASKKKRLSHHFDTHNCTARQIRLSLGLTLRDAAEAMELSQACLCDVERGSETTLTTARKMATFYGRTIDEIWPPTDRPKRRDPIVDI